MAALVQSLNCCASPSWIAARDLGAASGFDYLQGICATCGAAWMDVFCVATGISGYERISPADAAALAAIDDQDLKSFMRDWGERNL